MNIPSHNPASSASNFKIADIDSFSLLPDFEDSIQKDYSAFITSRSLCDLKKQDATSSLTHEPQVHTAIAEKLAIPSPSIRFSFQDVLSAIPSHCPTSPQTITDHQLMPASTCSPFTQTLQQPLNPQDPFKENIKKSLSLDCTRLSASRQTQEQPACFFPIFSAPFHWGHDCGNDRSLATPRPNTYSGTRLVMQISTTGSLLGTSLLSCAHNDRNDYNDELLDIESTPTYNGTTRDKFDDPTSFIAQSSVVSSPKFRKRKGRPIPPKRRTRSGYHCAVCNMKFKRKPDCSRHERFICPKNYEYDCIVCNKELCRRDSLMRHLTRNGGSNPCSKVLDIAQISNDAVASGRAVRADLGADRDIEAAFKKFKQQ